MPKGNVPKLLRRLWQVSALILNFVRLGWWVWRLRPKLLLMDDYREYLAPCWAWALRLGLRKAGTLCAANVHDPVRDFKIGPDWWHDWSVKQGYSFISIALTHEPVPEYANMPKRILRVVVPHGIYDLPAPTVGLRDLRGRFGVPEGLKVFLAFGFLRDNKNLDLLIRALAEVPGAFLLIAGRAQSQANRPMAFYRELAQKLGVEGRCHFHDAFVPEADTGNFFAVADFVALTYSATFHSQSGVINLAAAARVPVLASAAPGPLTDVVTKFDLGLVVAPDSLDEVVRGMKAILARKWTPGWDDYRAFAGWEANVDALLRAAKLEGADLTAENAKSA
jgi:glycosyltransferase involved in cell wall biosynthesis